MAGSSSTLTPHHGSSSSNNNTRQASPLRLSPDEEAFVYGDIIPLGNEDIDPRGIKYHLIKTKLIF